MHVTEYRRALHRIPELDRDLPETLAYLTGVLSPMRCALSSPIPGSLCAFFDFGQETAIAFRSDADALPVEEKTGLDFTSVHPGKMHACGHDGHMAMLLELAAWLNEQPSLPHNVLLVFQPAEETTGGAKDICASGVFERYKVQCIFGLHLWPDLPAGVIACRENELMIRSCEVFVQILGRSSHVAKAEEGIDALAAGVEFYRRATAMEKAMPPEVFRVFHIGRFESGTARNIVSGETIMRASLRAFRDDVFFEMQDKLIAIGREIEAETGCRVTVRPGEGHPAVWNPPNLYRQVKASGIAFTELEKPVMIAEDFSWYQRHLPGLFFLLGTGPSPALHADDFNFDETILDAGSRFWKDLALHFKGGTLL